MTSLIHPCQKRALVPLKFEVVFNYDTFFKVAQSYPHGPKLAQLTVYTNIYKMNIFRKPPQAYDGALHGRYFVMFELKKVLYPTDMCHGKKSRSKILKVPHQVYNSGSWVPKVPCQVCISGSWVPKVPCQVYISRSWVSRVPRPVYPSGFKVPKVPPQVYIPGSRVPEVP